MSSSTFDRWWGGDPRTDATGVLERAGVRYLNPHQTRHTYGHRLREHYTLEERKLLMGHDKISTTDHYYGTLTIEDVAAKMAVVGW